MVYLLRDNTAGTTSTVIVLYRSAANRVMLPCGYMDISITEDVSPVATVKAARLCLRFRAEGGMAADRTALSVIPRPLVHDLHLFS